MNTSNNYSPVTWKNKNTPVSTEYGDVYFSADNGIQESQYVFIDSNNLAARFSNTNSFNIAETGFGTGLNLALACKLWDSLSQPNSTLFITTFEKYPLALEDINKAADNWPELDLFYSRFLPMYTSLKPGCNIIEIKELRTVINIIIGDINDTITSLASTFVDCWFLDGFAPSVNPQMWTDTVISNVARSAKAGSTFSTFTAAGDVRRALIKHGFTVQKKTGFGKKREMIFGVLETD